MADNRLIIRIEDPTGRTSQPGAPGQQPAPPGLGPAFAGSTSVAQSQAAGRPVAAEPTAPRDFLNDPGRLTQRVEERDRYRLMDERIAEERRLERERRRAIEAQRPTGYQGARAMDASGNSRAAPDEPDFAREPNYMDWRRNPPPPRGPSAAVASGPPPSDPGTLAEGGAAMAGMGPAAIAAAIAAAIRKMGEAIVSAMAAAAQFIRDQGKVVAARAANEDIKADQERRRSWINLFKAGAEGIGGKMGGQLFEKGADLFGLARTDVFLQNRETFQRRRDELASFGGAAAAASAQARAEEINRNVREASILGGRISTLSAADQQLKMLERQNAILQKAQDMATQHAETSRQIKLEQEKLTAGLAKADKKLADMVKALAGTSKTPLQTLLDGVKLPPGAPTGLERLDPSATNAPPVVGATPAFDTPRVPIQASLGDVMW